VCLSVCLSYYLSVCLSVCLLCCLSVVLSMGLSVSLSADKGCALKSPTSVCSTHPSQPPTFTLIDSHLTNADLQKADKNLLKKTTTKNLAFMYNTKNNTACF